MNSMTPEMKARLIAEANVILDRIETNLRFIIESIKEKQKKAA